LEGYGKVGSEYKRLRWGLDGVVGEGGGADRRGGK